MAAKNSVFYILLFGGSDHSKWKLCLLKVLQFKKCKDVVLRAKTNTDDDKSNERDIQATTYIYSEIRKTVRIHRWSRFSLRDSHIGDLIDVLPEKGRTVNYLKTKINLWNAREKWMKCQVIDQMFCKLKPVHFKKIRNILALGSPDTRNDIVVMVKKTVVEVLDF